MHIIVVVVVPALTKGYERQPEIVFALVSGIETLISENMCH